MRYSSTPIETDLLCSYGCGNQAQYLNKSGNLMCCASHNSCPSNRIKNREATIDAYKTGKRKCPKEVYSSLSEEVKSRMAWNKGLTKENNESVAKYADKLRGRKTKGRPHTEETKRKISEKRSLWLKKSENRLNLGRHKRSWMETTFESYLTDNGIHGFQVEKHFWSDTLKKNFYADFLFEDKKLIVELDGTQHEKTKEKDRVRDEWFQSIGYKVIRVDVYEFKRRFFSGEGFLDILGR